MTPNTPLVRPESDAAVRQPEEARNATAVTQTPARESADLKGITDRMNETAVALNQSLKFEFSEHNRVIIKLVDTTTNQVIREIPPESLVRAFEQMQELMGLLVDRKL